MIETEERMMTTENIMARSTTVTRNIATMSTMIASMTATGTVRSTSIQKLIICANSIATSTANMSCMTA